MNFPRQLLVMYMNECDQFTKRELKAKYHIRYADNFVILNQDRERLVEIVRLIELFLRDILLLELHPKKVSIETLASGVDFLGWVHFPDHRVLRTSTKKRVLKRLSAEDVYDETRVSYNGLLSHGNTYKIQRYIEEFES